MRCFVAILVRAADRYNGYRPLVVCHLLRRQLRRMVDNILRVKSDVKKWFHNKSARTYFRP